jgi:MarR family transcriptional regulator, organic hydroperoxide resistance regulator
VQSEPETAPPLPREHIASEVAKRFAYLRRVVILEMGRILAPLGATVPLYHVLFRLRTAEDGNEPPLSQLELSLDAGLDAAGVSRLAAKMSAQKLVTVKVDAADRRRRLVRLTAKGRALEESLSPLVERAVRNMTTGLTEDEERLFLSLLDRVVLGTMHIEGQRRRSVQRARAARSSAKST